MVEVERMEGREVCAEFGEAAGPVDVFMPRGCTKASSYRLARADFAEVL